MTCEPHPYRAVRPLGICALKTLQEEGRWGGAHTNAHSRAAPGRGTHPLRAGSGAFPAPLGCHPVGPSGSKSLGLSPTKACALLPTSIGSLGSHSQGLCLEFLDALGISLEVGSSFEPIEQVHILLEKQC